MVMAWISNPVVWIVATFTFAILFIILLILLMILGIKTHAIIELKSWAKGIPISLFFQENRYVEWKAVEPDAGIIIDKNYGAFIVNEKATYVDKKTKNVMIPFDAQFGASINVRAAKLVDDLQYITKDEEAMKVLRHSIANNLMPESATIDSLKTSINFGAIKTMMTALIPHNLNAKIEKTIASRLKGYGMANNMAILWYFLAGLGGTAIAYLIIRTVAK